jgi:Right handed beta helix region
MSARSFRRKRQRRLAAERRREALRTRRLGLAAGAALGATAAFAPAADAANLVVTNTVDGGANSLRSVIATANANAQPDTITFSGAAASGTLRLTTALGAIPINAPTAADSLTINGPGSDVLAVSGDETGNGSPDTRIFYIASPATGNPTVSISGLTLTKGTANAGPSDGGAIYADQGTDVTITGAAITGSTTPSGNGAGIFASGDLEIANSTISGNAADSAGGGIFAKYHTTLTNSTISGNTADAGGGMLTFGLYGGSVDIDGSTISGNSAYGGAGMFNLTRLTITHSTLSGNTATGIGGALLQAGFKYAPLDLSDTLISGNSAARGGGMAIQGKYGGQVNRATISGNTASEAGAGLLLDNTSNGIRLAVTHSTISGNSGGPNSFGGGVAITAEQDGEFDLVDSTISGNTAQNGGGVSVGYSTGSTYEMLGPNGVIAFDNSTVAANSATGGGGGMFLGQYDAGSGNKSATVSLSSTIVADNLVGGAPQDLDRADGSTSGGFDLGFSLVEAGGDAPLLNAGTSIVGKDPLLAGLANNGGPTFTQLPAVNSPVVDQGTSSSRLKTDQRGEVRRSDSGQPNASDGTDIGSVERPGDKTPPKTQIKKKPKKKIKTPKKKIKVKLTFTSNEAGSTFMCKLDKGKFKTCKSPFKPKVSSKPGKGKKHTITVEAIDQSGNVDPNPPKVKFKVIRVPKH